MLINHLLRIITELYTDKGGAMRKPNVTPTNREIVLDGSRLIVSKTDLKGQITYMNSYFVEVSRYDELELLGKPHNYIRHPDMPRAIFKLLWDTIQNGEEINAYVKNLAKDGSYYWVLANVTPSFDKSGNIIGYFSVRRKPTQEALNFIKELYAKMLQIEKTSSMNASLAYLENLLQEKGVSYEEFITTL